jgi:hypothetical protein
MIYPGLRELIFSLKAFTAAMLSAVDSFPMLMLTLGLFLVLAGAFIPITPGTGLMLCVLTTVLLGLQPEYSASVADGVLGGLAGVGLTAVIGRVTMTRAPPGPRAICCAPAGRTCQPSRRGGGMTMRRPTATVIILPAAR